MEDLSASVDGSQSRRESVTSKIPVIRTEFVETPSYHAGLARKKLLANPGPSTEPPVPESIENSNMDSDSKNPLLTEVEEEHAKEAAGLVVGVAIFGIIVGGYYAWKWGWFKWPNAK
jgi:hypothetical protein